MAGRYCRVEPVDVDRHAAQLHAANLDGDDLRRWTYLGVDGFDDADAVRAVARPTHRPATTRCSTPSSTQAPVDAVGVAAYLRIDPANGVIEVGHINYSSRLQQTRAATEAMFLMMRRAFDELGYRRYEWKCDSLNEPSRRAAARLGFQFEGIFRQAIVYKGRNRDTAWFSILDREWPALRGAYEQWLAPGNFDEHGRQRHSLARLIAAARA